MLALSLGVTRQSVHGWLARHLVEGVPDLADRSHRPKSSQQQAATSVEVRVAELRRQHPRWGAQRIRLEMLRKPPQDWAIPSTRTIDRVLIRNGLVTPLKRRRPRDSLYLGTLHGGLSLVSPG